LEPATVVLQLDLAVEVTEADLTGPLGLLAPVFWLSEDRLAREFVQSFEHLALSGLRTSMKILQATAGLNI